MYEVVGRMIKVVMFFFYTIKTITSYISKLKKKLTERRLCTLRPLNFGLNTSRMGMTHHSISSNSTLPEQS